MKATILAVAVLAMLAVLTLTAGCQHAEWDTALFVPTHTDSVSTNPPGIPAADQTPDVAPVAVNVEAAKSGLTPDQTAAVKKAQDAGQSAAIHTSGGWVFLLHHKSVEFPTFDVFPFNLFAKNPTPNQLLARQIDHPSSVDTKQSDYTVVVQGKVAEDQQITTHSKESAGLGFWDIVLWPFKFVWKLLMGALGLTFGLIVFAALILGVLYLIPATRPWATDLLADVKKLALWVWSWLSTVLPKYLHDLWHTAKADAAKVETAVVTEVQKIEGKTTTAATTTTTPTKSA